MSRFGTGDRPASLRPALFAALALMSLTGCMGSSQQPDVTGSIPDDYHQRHPIVLSNSPHRLDIFLVGADKRLDARQTQDIQAFVGRYKAQGQGPIEAMVPLLPDERPVQQTFEAIRAQLAKAGLRGSIMVGKYRPADARLASAIQLSYLTLSASVATTCGDWPQDLASGSSGAGFSNKPYYNFGCASQKDFAMQIADPRDLVRARPEDTSDVNMRLRAIGNIEGGTDPGTLWQTHNTSISTVGSQ